LLLKRKIFINIDVFCRIFKLALIYRKAFLMSKLLEWKKSNFLEVKRVATKYII